MLQYSYFYLFHQYFPTTVQRYVAYIDEMTNEQLILADVNFDDAVTVFDATFIQRYVADIITRF